MLSRHNRLPHNKHSPRRPHLAVGVFLCLLTVGCAGGPRSTIPVDNKYPVKITINSPIHGTLNVTITDSMNKHLAVDAATSSRADADVDADAGVLP